MKYETKINNQAINIQTKTKCIFINVFFHSKNGDWGALLSGYIAPPGRESIVRCHTADFRLVIGLPWKSTDIDITRVFHSSNITVVTSPV